MFPNWLQKHIPRDVLQDKYLKISFSQNSEDDIVRAHFWGEILNNYKGTYLDLGCYGESLYSNTKLLNLVGWHGLAVDANPDFQKPWLEARPSDHFINCCISNSAEESEGIEFFRFKAGAMSTAKQDRAEQLISDGWPLQDIIKVPSISLSKLATVINELGFFKLDFVSIDLEMVNYLEDLPEFLSKLHPRLICMECITDELTLRTLFDSEEVDKLSMSNYTPINLVGGNIFAVPIS